MTDRYTDLNMPFYPFYPHMQRNAWEQGTYLTLSELAIYKVI